MTAIAPLVPPSCDLTGYDRMMIDIPRLRKSKHDALDDDTAWRAGFNLWFEAWHSVPAGSLEEDDATLRRAAGLGRDQATWVRIRPDVLRSWVKCSDGRLYHPTVCELALEAWLGRLSARKQSSAGNAVRHGKGDVQDAILAEIFTAMDALEALNSKSETLKKYRKRYGRQNVRTDAENGPNGPPKPSERTKNVRTDTKTGPYGLPLGSQAESRKYNSNTRANLQAAAVRARGSEGEPVPAEAAAAAPPLSMAGWDARLSEVFAALPSLNRTTTGLANIAPLKRLCEPLDGSPPCDWHRDVLPAIIAIAKREEDNGGLRAWAHPGIADLALRNFKLRTKGPKNGRDKTPRRSGSGNGSMVGALRRRKAARQLAPAPGFDDEPAAEHEVGDPARD